SLDRVSIVINYSDPNNILNFEVFNYSSEEFQELSPYLTSVTNNSRTFSFIKNRGSLEWLFDPSTRINHTILIKVMGTNSNPFNISINDFDIEFFYRDVNEYFVLGSRVIYRSSSGLVEYVRTSNSVSLSTIDMASIVAYAYLDNYNSYAGDINNFTIIIRNIGTSLAKNINVSIKIPGIIYDPSNFTIKNKHLTHNLAELPMSAEKQLTFSFYVPNSAVISQISINYSNSEIVQNKNSTILETHLNDVYYTAPIDYINRFPFVKTIEIFYGSLNVAPLINEELDLLIFVRITGLQGISVQNLTFSMGDQFGSLIPVNNTLLITPKIMYPGIALLNLTLKKAGWKGYYFSPINYFSALEKNTIQIASSSPIILGEIDFNMTKTVDKDQIMIGDLITVSITVINTGTICAKNLTINDAASFTGIDFSLISGRLIHTISTLQPGENITVSYQIQANTQALVKLKPAFIEYYYLREIREISNTLDVKIALPKLITISFVLGPSIASLLILVIFVWRSQRYKARKYELKRNELLLFKVSKSEAVLKVETTLRDKFKQISNEDKARNVDTDKGGAELI
ncbi:MAG: hypothetical protein ACFE96_19090, partial [Candidatus Hermodarchaeota archaeon]